MKEAEGGPSGTEEEQTDGHRARPAPPRRRRGEPKLPSVFADGDGWKVSLPQAVFSLDGFLEWVRSEDFPENARATFVGGDVFLDMSNEEAEAHVAVKTEVIRVLANLTRELDFGKCYTDGVRVTHRAAGLSCNPDATLLRFESLEAGRVRLIPRRRSRGRLAENEGTPDLVLEVISDSSVEKDTVRLRKSYHRAGVPEYWLIDARGDEVSFRILLRRRNRYVTAPLGDGWQHSPVLGRSFRLTREQDRAGLWDYTLHVRE